jgi:ComF family protein
MARAVTFYADPVSTLLHRLKYKYDTSAVPPLLKIAQSFDFSPFEACKVVIPVPLHPRRLRRRGLNHALVLARFFFPNKKEFIHSSILVRTLDTVSQTTLNGAARRKNLRSAFSVENEKVIENASVCLVDDVFTTGTTVIECSKALKEAGAAKVKVLTMARVKEAK